MKLSLFAQLPPPSWSVRVITIILARRFLAVGTSEILAPAGWDASYGIPLASDDGLSFVQAVGARNIAISLGDTRRSMQHVRRSCCGVHRNLDRSSGGLLYCGLGGRNGPCVHAFFAVLMGGICLWVAFSGRRGSSPCECAKWKVRRDSLIRLRADDRARSRATWSLLARRAPRPAGSA